MSIFSLNTGKYGPEKTPNADKFQAVGVSQPRASLKINEFNAFSSLVNIFSNKAADNYMLKVNNRNTRTSCEVCSKVTIKTPERLH